MRIKAVLLPIVIFLLSVAPALAQAQIQFSTIEQELELGEQVSIDLIAATDIETNAVELVFDVGAGLTVLEVSEPPGTLGLNKTSEEGRVTIDVAKTQGGFAVGDILATITVRASGYDDTGLQLNNDSSFGEAEISTYPDFEVQISTSRPSDASTVGQTNQLSEMLPLLLVVSVAIILVIIGVLLAIRRHNSTNPF